MRKNRVSMNIKRFFSGAVLISLVFFASFAFAQHSHEYGGTSTYNDQDQQLMDELKGIDGKQAMEIANKWRLRNVDVVSFVTTDAVHFEFKDGRTVSIPLPGDIIVISIAPYINKTHECAIHYMSKCDAELKNIPIKVKAVTAGGKILIDETLKTLPTGFLDLWLPINQEINVSIGALGKKATKTIYTHSESKTCDTTFKLE